VRKLEEFPVLLRGYEIQSELSDSFAAITSDCCLQVLGFRVYMQQQGLGLGFRVEECPVLLEGYELNLSCLILLLLYQFRLLVSRFSGSGFTCCSRVWSLRFRVYAARADDDKTHLHREGVVAKHK
jgi:hypothetical protein